MFRLFCGVALPPPRTAALRRAGQLFHTRRSALRSAHRPAGSRGAVRPPSERCARADKTRRPPAGGHRKIPPSRLGIPLPGPHRPAADRADVLRAAHRAEQLRPVFITLVDARARHPGSSAPWKLFSHGRAATAICRNSFRKLQARADQRRVVRVAQRIMRGPARLDLHDLQRRFSAFWLLEPSVCALKMSCALYHRLAQSASMPCTARFSRSTAISSKPHVRMVISSPHHARNCSIASANGMPCSPQDAVSDAGELGHLAVHFLKYFGRIST